MGHDMMGQIGTPIRIKSRTCASENDVQVFAVQDTFLYDLSDQFIFSSILYGVEIVQQVTDALVDIMFCFLQRPVGSIPELRLPEVRFQCFLLTVELLYLRDDVCGSGRVRSTHQGGGEVIDGGACLLQFFFEGGDALQGVIGVLPELKAVRIKADPPELLQEGIFHLLRAYVAGIAFCLALPHHICAAVVGKNAAVLLVGPHVHPGAALASQDAF